MAYLRACAWVDHDRPELRALASALKASAGDDPVAQVRACFDFVRDRVRHSLDHGDSVLTGFASEALREGTGFCYSKSHLLAALLRANGFPTGFVYQRLRHAHSVSGYCLHALNAVCLPDYGWVRLDARGERADLPPIRFDPPCEWLAYTAEAEGEGFLPGVYEDPLPVVTAALREAADVAGLVRSLPDAPL